MGNQENKTNIDTESLVDGQYGITDLLDIEELRSLCEDFTQATGFTIGFLDHPGLNILIATGWRKICTQYHRCSDIALENCIKSNQQLLNNLNEPGKLVIEKCENGLVDCAFPIIIKGKHIASLATGQLLTEEPDIEQFKNQAKLFEIDEEEYLESLKEIPVVSEEKLLHITAFLGKMALLLSELGYTRLTIDEESKSLKNEIATRKKIEKERKKLEIQLMQAQKMESIGRFAGAIAHDFNNMLSIILGFSELSLAQIDESNPLHSNILEISKVAESSASIIKQLLLFAGQQDAKSEVMNVNKVIRKLSSMLQMLVGNHIPIHYNLSESNLIVKIPPGQIDQILVNLCSNAKKAIKTRGEIIIETKKVTIAEKNIEEDVFLRVSNNDYVILSVKDNGCGMDKEIQENIFDPFFTTKKQGEGTGLGMSTVYGIIKKAKGFIKINSKIDQGTEVNIHIPFHEKTV